MNVSFNLKFYVGDEIYSSEVSPDSLADFTFAKLNDVLQGLAPDAQLWNLKWIDAEGELICLRHDADLAHALRNLHRVAGKDVLRIRLLQPALALGKATLTIGSSAKVERSSSPIAEANGVSTGPQNAASPEYVLAVVCKEEVPDYVQEANNTAPFAEVGSSADILEPVGYMDLAMGIGSAALGAHIKVEPTEQHEAVVDAEEAEPAYLDTAYLRAPVSFVQQQYYESLASAERSNSMQADEQVASSSGSARPPKEAKGCVKRKRNRKSARRSLRRPKQGNSLPKKPSASSQKTGRPRSTKQAKKTNPSEEGELLNLPAVAGRLTRRASKELAAQARAKQTTLGASTDSSGHSAGRSEMQTAVEITGDEQKTASAEERSREGEPKSAKHPSLAAEKAEEKQPEQFSEESSELELETRSPRKRHVADGINAGGEDQRDPLKEPEEKRSRAEEISDSENVEKHEVDEGNIGSINALIPDESMERWNQSWIHVFSCCVSNCGHTDCYNMKAVLAHSRLCKRRQDGNCPFSKQLVAVYYFHAETCFEQQCMAPFCLNVRRQPAIVSHPAGVAGGSLSQTSPQLVSTAGSAASSANVNTADNSAGSSHSTVALPGHCLDALAISLDDAIRRRCDGAGSAAASSNASQVRETVEAEVSSLQKEWREQFVGKGIKEKYVISQLVFASMKGYPPWPGRIQQPVQGRKTAKRHYYVFFYGTHQTAWFATKDLYPFDEYAATFGHPRPNNRGSKGFNVAMWELMNDTDVQVDADIPENIPSDQAWAAALDAVKHGQAFLGLDEDDGPLAKRHKVDTGCLKEKNARTPRPKKAADAGEKVLNDESFQGMPGSSGLKDTPGKAGRTGKADKEKSAPFVKPAPTATLAVKIAPNGKCYRSVSEASCQDKPKLKWLASVSGILVPAVKSARISLPSKRYYDEAKCVIDKQHTVSFTSAKPREGLNEVVEPNPTATPDRNASAAGSKESRLALGIIEDAALKQDRIPKLLPPQKPASEKPSADEIHKSELASAVKPAASRGEMKINLQLAIDYGTIKSNIASKESHVAAQATPAAAQAAAAKQTASAGSSVSNFSEDVAP